MCYFTVDTCVRGCHVCGSFWAPIVGEKYCLCFWKVKWKKSSCYLFVLKYINCRSPTMQRLWKTSMWWREGTVTFGLVRNNCKLPFVFLDFDFWTHDKKFLAENFVIWWLLQWSQTLLTLKTCNYTTVMLCYVCLHVGRLSCGKLDCKYVQCSSFLRLQELYAYFPLPCLQSEQVTPKAW